jgi:hypothetical protein
LDRAYRPIAGGLAASKESTMTNHDNNAAGRWLAAAAVLGIASVVAVFAILGLDVDGAAGGARLVGAVTLATALVVGLRLRSTHPVVSTVLLIAGAAAPVAAWYDVAPVYVLSLAIAVVTWFARPMRPRADAR